MMETVKEILQVLRKHGDRRNVEGMVRFGITSAKAFGVPAPVIRSIAKSVGKNHELALLLWKTGILEARILSGLVGDPARVTRALMNTWVKDLDNWAVCDGICGCLFDKTPWAYTMAKRWSTRNEEFVKRAGFVMMASLAVHDKKAPDDPFLDFLPLIVRGSTDARNFVKKGVNWALRQIGKRNEQLNAVAIKTAERIHAIDSPSARWIASDAIRELRSDAVHRRIRRKQHF